MTATWTASPSVSPCGPYQGVNEMNETIERSQTHATFVTERTYPVPVEAVWHALSGQRRTRQWCGAGSAFDIDEKSHDSASPGTAREEGQWHGGSRARFDSTYTDIVDLQRIVFTYDMWVDGRHISTSLTASPWNPRRPDPADLHRAGRPPCGLDNPEGREEGTAGLLDPDSAPILSAATAAASYPARPSLSSIPSRGIGTQLQPS